MYSTGFQERNKFLLDRNGENPVFDYWNEDKAEELFRAHCTPHTEVAVQHTAPPLQ